MGLDLAALPSRPATMWRYADVLPIDPDPWVTLGEGVTPLVRSSTLPNVRLKLDFLMPTLSFKDRGAVVLATLAKRLGVASAMVDSSGNAGTAAAAYFARAGIPCTVLVPASTSAGKLAQMHAHRATVDLVPGSRAATSAAEQAMEQGSDAPVPADGVATIAEGIAIAAPPRGAQILRAVRATGGTIVSVSDARITAAQIELAEEGLFVEPTSAVCWAAIRAAVDGTADTSRSTWRAAIGPLTGGQIVVPLCGAGLKSPGKPRSAYDQVRGGGS